MTKAAEAALTLFVALAAGRLTHDGQFVLAFGLALGVACGAACVFDRRTK